MAEEAPVYAVWHDNVPKAGDWQQKEYVEAAVASLGRHKGELLTWDDSVEAFEGKPTQPACCIVKFPSRAAFDAWYKDEGYAPALKNRLAASGPGSFAFVSRGGVHKD
eukprot:Hpha_TRINITY_DN11206_c0_g1::TRINITY_DN11206_c0_g1_i1::g.167416::m.167416